MPNWTPFNYAQGWSDYGNGFQSGGFLIEKDRVSLRGVITTDLSTAAPSLVATLPVGLLPPATQMFAGLIVQFVQGGDSVALAEFQIDTSGNLTFNSTLGQANGKAVSLNDFSFSVLP